ncbi:N-acetylglucosaminyl deacetylase, LmbE family [Zunongwangia mangrovi]|uniref:N-acetylglucosaminyl deacetylase, LmbE family n=1 Tax=Zunongwangia mangrovi TaxID=1334022 RepID=A0A1I1M882_9FLAO|nr:PIG-L family deacetylase [Zunongwangia mangrovi]SFC81609.1 N-acetylglucosaminyl deacetylase, LmbE family [Zunongwangia mangrovi]
MRKILPFLLLFLSTNINAQAPQKLSASEIYEKIEKLNFLGSVLYLAAHPDDENTRLISYFSNQKHARTAYLSLTRGDGGQNLIGPEIREQLGLIRTQELLAARRIDGGQQFFSRANDFGYSKNPDETLKTWNKDEVLSDVVWVIRNFKPDVIINRFDHRTPGTTHGHHTSSAILSVEAFDITKDKSIYPDQLKYTSTWQPERMFFNTSSWFFSNQQAFREATKDEKYLTFDTGVYFPLKGLSNPEIASLSRSQHQSQGFGSTGSRGSEMEFLELVKGSQPASREDVFSGINTSWTRVEGGAEIGEILGDVQQNFDFTNPSSSLPQLLEAYSLIQELEDEHWKSIKSEEIKSIIEACAGLYLEAVSNSEFVSPGDHIRLNLEAINRSNAEVELKSIALNPQNRIEEIATVLRNNEDWKKSFEYKVPKDASYTSPYWLNKEGTVGMYRVDDRKLIGKPETPHTSSVTFKINITGTSIPFEKEIVYKYNDNVTGENYENFEIIPPVSVGFLDDVILFPNQESKNIRIKVTAEKDNTKGTLKLNLPSGWQTSPRSEAVNLPQKGSSITYTFKITPPSAQSEIWVNPVFETSGETYQDEVITIDYPHIPTQTLVVPSKLKLAKIDIQKKGENIGYIAGAGDVVPESLRQIGYTVSVLNPATITAESLANYDAVVTGVRAYNVLEELRYKNDELLKYVENGGTLVSQYNKDRGITVSQIGPFPFKLSYDRVTEEDAEVNFVAPDSPVLNSPNKITKSDFEGWVQERGLYFPHTWDVNYSTVLSMHDKNEGSTEGSLLVTKYGKGYYVYTGLSFFRQFPAGVAGSYRLFANLLSLGK